MCDNAPDAQFERGGGIIKLQPGLQLHHYVYQRVKSAVGT
jgi:hypothetical protein